MEKPGMDSSLSMVPPVWPKPLPLIFAQVRPQAAAMGKRASEVLSPTPPVECLSALIPGRRESSSMSPLSAIAIVSARVSFSVMPRKKIAIIIAESW